MNPDSKAPNEAQQKKLCEMLHHALIEIRALAASGHGARASDLADVFHNLPHEMWRDYFSISNFRRAFLIPYARKWDGGYDYMAALALVESLA